MEISLNRWTPVCVHQFLFSGTCKRLTPTGAGPVFEATQSDWFVELEPPPAGSSINRSYLGDARAMATLEEATGILQEPFAFQLDAREVVLGCNSRISETHGDQCNEGAVNDAPVVMKDIFQLLIMRGPNFYRCGGTA